MTDPWQTIAALARRLEDHSTLPREQRILLQLLKIQEEAGEVAEAVIGAMGQNPRKGHSHTWYDVESEVCDVITTGMVALIRMNTDGRAVFERHLEHLTARDLARKEPEPGTVDTAADGTAALLVNADGQYLLHLRDANKPIAQAGKWSLLGGHLEPGESHDEAITRELQEEAGLYVPGLTPFATVENVAPNGTVQGSVRIYLGRWDGPAHEIDLREGIAVRWTHADEIRWMTMDPGTAAVIKAHQADPDGERSIDVRVRVNA